MRLVLVAVLLTAEAIEGVEYESRSPTYGFKTTPSRLSTAEKEMAVIARPSFNGTIMKYLRRPNKLGSIVTKSVSSFCTNFLDFLKQHILLLLPGRGQLIVRPEDEVSASYSKAGTSVRKVKPRYIQLNVMVAGISGLGKTTACNELFTSWRLDKGPPNPNIALGRRTHERRYGGNHLAHHQHRPPEADGLSARPNFRPSLGRGLTAETKAIDTSRTLEREDALSNTYISLNLIDTPGLGQDLNPKKSLRPIVRFLQKRKRAHYRAENKFYARGGITSKKGSEDQLVHCCLYFLSPHRLLAVDRLMLKELARQQITIIPIVAKSDTLTNSELQEYRHVLQEQFKQCKLLPHIFNLDQDAADLYGEATIKNTQGPNTDYLPLPRNRQRGDSLALLARDGFYPWGASRVHNPDHSDFRLLREKLLVEHTENLIEAARNKYSTFRNRAKKVNKAKNVATSLLLSAFLIRQLIVAFDHNHQAIIDSPPATSKRKFLINPFGFLFRAKSNQDNDEDQSDNGLLKRTGLSKLLPGNRDPNADPVDINRVRAQQALAVFGGLLGIYLIAPSPF